MYPARHLADWHREEAEGFYVAFPVRVVKYLHLTEGAGGTSQPLPPGEGRQTFGQALEGGTTRSRGIRRLRAIVQPFRRKIFYNGEERELDCIYEVPVAQYQAHSFMIRTPLSEGDIGMVLVSDIALDELLTNRRLKPVDRNRVHSLEDAVFINWTLRVDSDPFTPGEALDALCLYVMEGAKPEEHTGVPIAKLILTPEGDLKGVFRKVHIRADEFHADVKSFKVGEGSQAVAVCPTGCSSVLYTDGEGLGYTKGLTEPEFYKAAPDGDPAGALLSEILRGISDISPTEVSLGLDLVKRGLATLSEKAYTSLTRTLRELEQVARRLL